MLVMIIRFITELVFKLNYSQFFSNKSPQGNSDYAEVTKEDGYEPRHVVRAFQLMNGFISEVLDPNLCYSRLSFLESGKDAIDLKESIYRGKSVG